MHAMRTVIVLVLAAGAVVAMVLDWRGRDRAPQSTTSTARLLPAEALPIDHVTRITLRRAGEIPLVFERSGVNWRQVEPFAHPMDPFSIRQLMVQVTELEAMHSMKIDALPGDGALERLSLDPPLAEISYEWPQERLVLQLGRRSMAGRAYVRVSDDDRVHVVRHHLHERAVETDPKEWRDRTIFQDAGADSERIEWEQGGVRRFALLRDRRQWKMVEPARTRVDAAELDRLLNDLGRARLGGFLLDQPSQADLEKFGLANPGLVLSVHTAPRASAEGANGRPPIVQRLLVGARVGAATQDRFGLVEGRAVVVRVPAAVLGALFRAPSSMAAATASGTNPADVKAIVLRTSSHELRLERDLDRWRAPVFGNGEVSAALVQELLHQLTGLRATEVEIAEYPQQLEIASITFHGFDARPIDTVRVAREGTDGRWALENGDGVLRIYPPAMKIRMTAEDFNLPAQ